MIRLALTLSFLLAALNFSSAQNFADKVIETLKKSVEEYPQEKIYLHLDKPYYVSGEIMWFKAYHVAGSYHQPSPLSNTIYVELLNHKNNLVKQIILKSDSGFAAGNILLPDSLNTGNYLLRAFTPWMRNFSESYFYHREISILNPSTTDAIKKEETIDIQFFPESGDLLTGVLTKIGFKAVGADGLSREVKIKIVDNTGAEVVKAESNRLGMGAFSIVAEGGKKYFALINELKDQRPLPEAKATGFNIAATVLMDKPNVTLRLQSTPTTPGKQNATLVCHTRGIVNYVAKVDLTPNIVFVQIPKANLLSGISTITLFDGNDRAVAERLIFIDQNDELRVTITPNKANYTAREEVKLTIKVTDANQNPVAANLSLAVCDNQQVILDENNAGIKNYLLLTSDLVGHIETPGYYFNTQNADRFVAVDFLMLTQGWRRYNWSTMLEGKWPTINFLIDRGLTINGTLKDLYTRKPVAGGKVTYLSTGSDEIQIATTNELGRFSIYNLVYYDSTKSVLQGENKKGKKAVAFDIDKFEPPISTVAINPFLYSSNNFERSLIEKSLERKRIDASYKFDGQTIMLEGVEVKAEKIMEEVTSRMYGKGNATIMASDIPGSITYQHPLQLIQGRVSGVQVTGSGLSYNVTIRGVGSTSNNSPLIMVDNIATDINTLSSIPVSAIESVEIFKGPEAAVFGSEGSNGAILFYTKRGARITVPPMGIYNVQLSGYYTEKEFYSPRYDVKQPEHVKPDIRTTIYWNPHIKTNENGEASLSFFTNDNVSTVTGIIEGISGFGKVAHGVFHYKVE
jgi:hypothetical protein